MTPATGCRWNVNEYGTCTLWVKSVVDPEHSQPRMYVPSEDDDGQHVVIMKIATETLSMQMVFRRGEFAKMMAEPNGGEPIELTVGIEEEE